MKIAKGPSKKMLAIDFPQKKTTQMGNKFTSLSEIWPNLSTNLIHFMLKIFTGNNIHHIGYTNYKRADIENLSTKGGKFSVTFQGEASMS